MEAVPATCDPQSVWHTVDAIADNLCPESRSVGPKKKAIEIEVETYLKEFQIVNDPDVDILQYWFANRKRLPQLARLPREILCIQVTSALSESVISWKKYRHSWQNESDARKDRATPLRAR